MNKDQSTRTLLFRILTTLEEIKTLMQVDSFDAEHTWIDTPAYCKMLGISETTAKKHRAERRIGFSKMDGVIRYRVSDVQEMLMKHYSNSK